MNRGVLIAGGIVLGIIVILALLSSFWFGLGVLLMAALGVAGYWAWTQLPERYGEGPDKAERAQQEKWRSEMEED